MSTFRYNGIETSVVLSNTDIAHKLRPSRFIVPSFQQVGLKSDTERMSRYLAFLLALLSVSGPRCNCFANGFLMLSWIPSSITTSSLIENFVSHHSGARQRTSRRGSGIAKLHVATPPISQDRNRRTRLFSQTRTPPTGQQEQPKPQATPETKAKKFNAAKFAVTEGPDLASKPDYENIHGPLGKTLDDIFLYVFRSKLAEHVGVDSKLPKTDFSGLMELTAAMNARYSDRRQIQKIAQQTLRESVSVLCLI